MICTQCGKDNSESNLFCGTCGSRLERRHEQRRQGDRRLADRRQNVAADEAGRRTKIESRAPHAEGPAGASGGAVLRTPPARPGLDRDFAARTEAPVREPLSPARRVNEPVAFGGGPSFLGLGETSNNYLLEDDAKPRRSYGRFITLLILLAAVAAVGWNWDKIKQAATSARDQSVVGAPSAQPAATPAPSADGLPVGSGQPPAAPGSDTQAGGTQAQPAGKDSAAPSDNGPAKGADQQPQSDNAADDNATDDNAAPASDSKSAPDAAPAATTAPKKHAARQVPRNDKQEERIAATNPADQSVKVADRYLYGTEGVSQDCGRAMSILNGAAGKGSFEAATKLGVLYATGTCVPFDRVRAYNWYTTASRSNDSAWLERNKSMLWSQMSDAEKQQVAGR